MLKNALFLKKIKEKLNKNHFLDVEYTREYISSICESKNIDPVLCEHIFLEQISKINDAIHLIKENEKNMDFKLEMHINFSKPILYFLYSSPMKISNLNTNRKFLLSLIFCEEVYFGYQKLYYNYICNLSGNKYTQVDYLIFNTYIYQKSFNYSDNVNDIQIDNIYHSHFFCVCNKCRKIFNIPILHNIIGRTVEIPLHNFINSQDETLCDDSDKYLWCLYSKFIHINNGLLTIIIFIIDKKYTGIISLDDVYKMKHLKIMIPLNTYIGNFYNICTISLKIIN